jgi:hypothetical protein
MKSMLTSRSLISGLALIPLLAPYYVHISVHARELDPRWACPSPKPHPDAKCLTLVSYNSS